MPDEAQSKSSWYLPRVSVRALMFLVLAIGAGLGWTMHVVREARTQRESVSAIKEAGGDVFYDCELDPDRANMVRRPRYLEWLDGRVGIDYFSNVVEVMLPGDLTDVELRLVGRFPRIERVLYDGSRSSVTDAWLAHLDGLANLRELDLSGTYITDAGLVHVKGMRRLRNLDLGGTGITDAGLVHLSGLTNLVTLDLRDTHVTKAGVVHLKGLINLRSLDVWGTGFDDFAAQDLRRALPKVSVVFDRIWAM
jgi:hypothetical protein